MDPFHRNNIKRRNKLILKYVLVVIKNRNWATFTIVSKFITFNHEVIYKVYTATYCCTLSIQLIYLRIWQHCIKNTNRFPSLQYCIWIFCSNFVPTFFLLYHFIQCLLFSEEAITTIKTAKSWICIVHISLSDHQTLGQQLIMEEKNTNNPY